MPTRRKIRQCRRFSRLALVLYWLFAEPAIAEPPALEAGQVAAFVDALPTTGTLLQSFAAHGVGETGVGQGIGAAVEAMTAAGRADELDALVRAYGFRSTAAWLAVGQRVMRAYLALTLTGGAGPTGPDPSRMLAVPHADLAAVAPFADAIGRALDGGGASAPLQ